MAQLTAQFIEGVYYAICQKQATNSDVASILSYAKSMKDAVSIIRKLPKAEKFFNPFHGLSCNWMDHLLCVGEQPSHFQAIMLAYAGINRFVDLTEAEQDYFEILPQNISYYKTTISNDRPNKPDPISFAIRAVLESINRHDRVYLHCQSGLCRSAIVASLIAAIRQNVSYLDGIKIVKLRRPVAQPQFDLLSLEDADIIIERFKNETGPKI